MEDNKRKENINEEELGKTLDTEPKMEEISPSDNVQKVEEPADSQTEAPAEQKDESLGDNQESLLPTDASTDAPSAEVRPMYHWNYEQSRVEYEKDKKKKAKNGALVYAVVVSAAFIICFAALIFLLLFNNNFSKDPAGSPSDSESLVRVEERIVYVREYDKESGVLTTQEIYDKCLPSVVSLLVSDGTKSGTGSGFIITADGYIATANHVVQGMSTIKAILHNGEIYDAEIIDGNDYTDIALIKINKNGLTPIKIGSSDKLLVGDDVVAIGTPVSIDFSGSLAHGAVSYKNRMLKIYNEAGSAVEKKMILIQTNALVNPGNSGCPLINEYGEVIGIVTMKLNSTYYEGMCFAIPIDSAMPIIEAMKKGENYDALLSAVSVSPAVLGITGQNVQISSSGAYGVKIESFSSSDYDAASKLKVDDVITHIDGVAVSSITELRLVLDTKLPDQVISVTFYRSGQSMTVNVRLEG